jgi:adenylylsulfate kinase
MSVIWITGLSGAGKSTIARKLIHKTREIFGPTILLDGDEVREALGKGASNKKTVTRDERLQLAFQYSKLAKLISEQETIAVVATISMFKEIQKWNRKNIKKIFGSLHQG